MIQDKHSIIQLPIFEYLFTFQALDEITFPEFSGSRWHSVLGKALHQLVCLMPHLACEQCQYACQCDYVVLFKGTRPANSSKMRKYPSIPVPHIFQSCSENQLKIPSGKTFQVKINLLGKANQYLKTLIYAMEKVANNGFGRERSQARLIQAEKIDCNEKPCPISSQPRNLPEASDPLLPQLPARVRIKFLSPYKPSGDSANKKQFDLAHFLMALIRRMSLLQYFYTEQEMDCDFKSLKSQTEWVRVIVRRLEWRKHRRYSAKKGKTKDTSGWLGWVEIEIGDYPSIWPFLFYGQWLNVGKNASLGFGQYVLEIQI